LKIPYELEDIILIYVDYGNKKKRLI